MMIKTIKCMKILENERTREEHGMCVSTIHRNMQCSDLLLRCTVQFVKGLIALVDEGADMLPTSILVCYKDHRDSGHRS